VLRCFYSNHHLHQRDDSSFADDRHLGDGRQLANARHNECQRRRVEVGGLAALPDT
jgi:hypothetical protein